VLKFSSISAFWHISDLLLNLSLNDSSFQFNLVKYVEFSNEHSESETSAKANLVRIQSLRCISSPGPDHFQNLTLLHCLKIHLIKSSRNFDEDLIIFVQRYESNCRKIPYFVMLKIILKFLDPDAGEFQNIGLISFSLSTETSLVNFSRRSDK